MAKDTISQEAQGAGMQVANIDAVDNSASSALSQVKSILTEAGKSEKEIDTLLNSTTGNNGFCIGTTFVFTTKYRVAKNHNSEGEVTGFSIYFIGEDKSEISYKTLLGISSASGYFVGEVPHTYRAEDGELVTTSKTGEASPECVGEANSKGLKSFVMPKNAFNLPLSIRQTKEFLAWLDSPNGYPSLAGKTIKLCGKPVKPVMCKKDSSANAFEQHLAGDSIAIQSYSWEFVTSKK